MRRWSWITMAIVSFLLGSVPAAWADGEGGQFLLRTASWEGSISGVLTIIIQLLIIWALWLLAKDLQLGKGFRLHIMNGEGGQKKDPPLK